jgi:hypothetical protein
MFTDSCFDQWAGIYVERFGLNDEKGRRMLSAWKPTLRQKGATIEELMAAANICDEIMGRRDGTAERRYTVNGAVTTNGATTVVVATGATTFKKGDIFTVAGCNRVHPETKVDTGALQQFVVAADYAGGAGTLSFAPAIYTTLGRQNVVAAGMANGNAITKIGGASAVYKPSIVFHPDAFAFATADLVMPSGVDFSARQVMDGLSMRIVRQYDINNDKFPCRLDVLYGYKTIRPQLACRILSN